MTNTPQSNFLEAVFGSPSAETAHQRTWDATTLRERGVEIVREPKQHRDGSVSCYCRDPGGNMVQILWLPEMMQP